MNAFLCVSCFVELIAPAFAYQRKLTELDRINARHRLTRTVQVRNTHQIKSVSQSSQNEIKLNMMNTKE